MPDSTLRPGRIRLTLRGVAFLLVSAVIFITAYALSLRELLYVSITLAGMPLASMLFLRLRRPRLTVSRSFAPHTVEAGEWAIASLTVRNIGAWPTVRARWWDAVPWDDVDTDVGELPALAVRSGRFADRGSAVTLEYHLRSPRRGIFPVGPLMLELGDALGFAVTVHEIGETHDVVVTPRVVALAESGLSVAAGDGRAQLVQRRSSGDDDDAMTREYRSGDALRRVHWRASARHGELMVRQEEQRTLPEARLILDTRAIGYQDAAGDERTNLAESDAFEWAISMMASASIHLRRHGFRVAVSETARAQLGGGSTLQHQSWQDEAFLTELAGIRLLVAPGALGAAQPLQQGARGEGPIIAFMGSPDSHVVEWMLRQRRGVSTAVAFMVSSASAFDVFSRAVGQDGSRRQFTPVAERFHSAGWLVVPVRSDDDPASCWESVVFDTTRSKAGR